MTDQQTALTDDEELAILFPQPIELKIGKGGLSISVLPMDTATCMRFMHKARPIFKKAAELEAAKAAVPATADAQFKTIMLAAADYPAELLDALSIATGRSSAFIGKLPPGSSAALAFIVYQANIDFFVRNVGALAFGVQGTEEKPGTNGAGPTH